MKTKHLVFILLSVFSIESAFSKSIPSRKIIKMLKSSAILNDHFTGFALYDLTKRKMISGQHDDKYFTPASNTKLFTFYAGLKLLKDSIAGLQYVERGDSLIFWGTADPVFLDPQFKEQRVLQNLNSARKQIYRAKGIFSGDFYGTGWTYDDYNEYYQPEMSDFPIYGNVVRFSRNPIGLQTYPVFNIGGKLILQTDRLGNPERFRIKREIFSNIFHQPSSSAPTGFNQLVPFKVSDDLIADLLKQSIANFSGNINYPKPAQTKVWYSIAADTLYKKMLSASDNFIAEQILLNIAASRGMEMNTAVVIDYVKKNFLTDLPDKAVWVDGSGLSRQNLFTPRSMVRLCEKIYDEVGDQDRLFDLLAQGGKTGTLKNLFKADEPFIFAKTGSLSNNHNLSGYLITASGKKLIFSFMNNNFTRPTAEVRSEMEKLITQIYKNY
ncbi:MAG: D-alanyl-D-alanine carboxypeptidase [Daejeonella sp.]|uniref:D-alanyl-D-alanine carboxypeptidase/D-alanyl-D-alanine-endopeptidase n=1 Tax=Daejeonella sp. TaxID=2805397 RepID=UPI002732CA0C|nr:D-alanyl-D-alanine carboxypeptidase [Daejeonella sp.]MDP3467143.1 D-alanyl-D-alanine carboxypeptidase [Daejeonella sp.]